MQWNRQLVTTKDGTALAVWTAGSASDEPVVLVHGFSLDHSTWGPVAEALLARGFRVIAPDLRGHGESPLGTAEPTIDRLVGDVRDVVDALESSAVHLAGHSLGAVVGLAARVDRRVAGSVKTVTSIAGTERAVQNPVMKLGARLFSSRLGSSLLDKRRPGRVMISTWFGKNPTQDHLDWIRQLSASCGRATRLAVATATADVDLRSTFSAEGAQTLVLSGARDQAVPAKISMRIAEAIDGAEVYVVEDAGHMVIIEDPEFVVEKLSDWMARYS